MLKLTKDQPKPRKKYYKSQAKSAEYWQDLKQRFEENTRIKPFEEWADGYEMPSEDATELSLNGLTPEEIRTLYRELGGLKLSDINEQLIIKKAVVAEVQFWKEEIERLIEVKHPVFNNDRHLLTNLGFVNSFLFILLTQTGCVKYTDAPNPVVTPEAIGRKIALERKNLEEKAKTKAKELIELRKLRNKRSEQDATNGEETPPVQPDRPEVTNEDADQPKPKKKNGRPKKNKFELVKLNIPMLVQTIQTIQDFDGTITHSTTFVLEVLKNHFPGAYQNKFAILPFRDWMKAQGLLNFRQVPCRLSTKGDIFPFIPTSYDRVDIARIFTFAMALEQVILGRVKQDKEDPEKDNLKPEHAATEAFDDGLPSHKVNFLRLAFNTLFDGITEWGRAGETYGTQGWLPTVNVGLSELEELIWTKFCRSLRWVTGFKPKIA